jgi:hypothetical protein
MSLVDFSNITHLEHFDLYVFAVEYFNSFRKPSGAVRTLRKNSALRRSITQLYGDAFQGSFYVDFGAIFPWLTNNFSE